MSTVHLRPVAPLWAAVTCSLFLLSQAACVIRFANSERRVDSTFRKIYVPSATDSSTRGGQAARISAAIRQSLALDTRFALASMEEARWALDVQIVNSARTTVTTADCKAAKEPEKTALASGAYSCENAQLSFYQPDVSSESEQVFVSAEVRAIDLQTGRTLFAKRFDRVGSGAFAVVGNDETQRALSSTPELHALRYVENADKAVEGVAGTIAAETLNALLTLDPAVFQATPTPAKEPTPVPVASPTALPTR